METMMTVLLCASLAWALILVCLACLQAQQRRQSRQKGVRGWTNPKRKKN